MNHTKPPYKLGQVINLKEFAQDCSEDGAFVTIDAKDHGGLAIVVWRLSGDTHSPNQEATAKFIIKACNSYDPMYELIQQFGDAVADMFDQLVKGKWLDGHGHPVAMNAAMLALREPIKKAVELRENLNSVVAK